jgi:hypothetical protein
MRGLVSAVLLLWALPVYGQVPLEPALEIEGTVDFFATGGSFTVNDDADDRPDALLDEGEVRVETRDIPPRARLLQAFLYFGGSLYDDGDGIDAPDETVELATPGADFRPVVAETVSSSGPIDGFPEVTLYTARADVTALVAGGPMAGRYRIRGFDADIFDGAQEHTAANASFSLVLVFDEERLPPRAITIFDGLQPVLGSTVSLSIGDLNVSPLPSGALTFYALEGDCHPGPDRCDSGENLSGPERIRVLAPQGRHLLLRDEVNPPNDIFNRTINTVSPALRGVVGTDIDRFDLSSLLRPGDDEITVEVTAPRPAGGNRGELIGLAYIVVGIDVFAPELALDSRVQVRSELGDPVFFAGDPLSVVVALSNTGNLTAEDVQVELELPELVDAFEVATASATVDGRRVTATVPSVRDGEVEGLRLRVRTRCPLPDGDVLALTATVSASRLDPFVVSSTVAIASATECGDRFGLFGGGGCQGGGRDPILLLLLLFAPFAWWLRRRKLYCIVFALGLAGTACGGADGAEDRPGPAPFGATCPSDISMVVVPSIRGEPPFCIDPFEASLELGGAVGNVVQPPGGDGSTTAVARTGRFVLPARGLSWHQAAAACANAGKALCTATQWQAACGGVEDLTYPYGEVFEPTRCNGFAAGRGDVVPTGGLVTSTITPKGENLATGCVSAFGVYDMSGNVWEWNASPRLGGLRRGLAGGSFRSNATGLSCLTQDADAEPSEVNEAYGFRCCRTLGPGPG